MGMFDDLIPSAEAKGDLTFDDLIPSQDDAPQEIQPRQSEAELFADNFADPMTDVGDFKEDFNLEGEDVGTGLVNQAGQGATFGLLDEAQAAVLSMVGTALPESMGGFPDGASLTENYQGLRDTIRFKNKEFKEANPKAAVAAEVAGGALSGGAGLTKTVAAKAGSTIAAKALTGAVTGAALGGLTGAGKSEAELVGDDKDRAGFAADVGKGAATGLIVGGALAGAGAKISEKIAKTKGVKELLSSKNLPETIKNETDSQKVFEAIDDVADKVIIKGAPTTHKQAANAIDMGFKKGDVFAIRSSSDATRRGGFKMISDYQRILNDSRFGQTRQVTDAVGESALKRIDAIQKINTTAGRQVNEAASNLKGVSIDVSDEIASTQSKLSELGVRFADDGKMDFKESAFQGFGSAQKAIVNVVNRLNKSEQADANDIHQLKQFIDSNVTFGAGNKTGAQKKAETFIKGLRFDLNEKLKGVSSNYDKANAKYSDTIEILNDVRGVAGKNGVNARTLGLLANRVDSRAVSSARIGDIYSSLDDVAAKYGVRFKDSVSDLHVIANSIDSTLPNVINNSLQGQTTNAIDKVAQARGRTITDGALELGSAALNKISKNRDVNAQIKAMKDLLKSNTAFKQ